jgi:nicotinamidase-related amidase
MHYHGLEPDRSSTALLILDMISEFRFPDGDAAARAALRVAPAIARLGRRVRDAGFSVLYVNDNPGRWRSDGAELIRRALGERSRGARIAAMLKPDEEDYFILKPRHSAFYATPLELLLENMGAKRLILAGVTSHQCVLFTATDAHLRNFELVIPADCVASPSASQTRFALRYVKDVLGAKVSPLSSLRIASTSRHGK